MLNISSCRMEWVDQCTSDILGVQCLSIDVHSVDNLWLDKSFKTVIMRL